MPTILLIEDDTALRNGLAFDLSAEGYNILSAENGKTAITLLEQPTDLVLLDINLPDTDGFLLCCEIKKRKNIPVVFLTCRDLESDELCGFDCGADDYVTKPFSMPLLRKRIAAVLKRNGNNNVYSDGFLKIDFEKHMAYAGEKGISFTPTEYKLLQIFISNSGSVLTRRILLEKLWDNENNFVDEHTLTVNINRIRSKIEEDNHKYIKTVYGIGYIWNGEKQ